MLKVGRERWNNLINCIRALRPVDASDHSQGCEGLVDPIYSIVVGQGLDHNSSSTEIQPVVTTLIRYYLI